jgi:hypothetical protein
VSGYTGTQNEVLYANAGPSTNLASFTAEDNLQKTLPPVIIPPGLFAALGARSTTLKLRACGQVGSTATPTFTFTARLLTSTTWSAGGIVLGSSAALTTGSGVTLAPFQIDLDIMLRALAPGGASTVVTMGTITSQTAFASAGFIPAANVSPAVATIDNTQQYYLFLSAACSASSPSNLINLQLLKLYGEN